MATVTFIGALQPIAQVVSSQLDVYDGAGTYTLTVGAGNLTEVISVAADTDAATTIGNLVTAWNASTHPYCKYITASAVTDVITLTADTPGAPFTVVSGASGGTASMTAISVDTANQSGSDVSLAGNYEGGALASNGDTFIHDASAPALAWGLDQSAKTSIVFHSPRGAGNIGLNRMAFAISADGQTADQSAREYREDYLKMDMAEVHIGEEVGPSLKAAATRIKLDNTRAGASTTTVYSVAGVSADPGKPTLRLLTTNSAANVFVRSAEAGWGIAVDDGNETSTAGAITCVDAVGSPRTYLGQGCTWTLFKQLRGEAFIHNAIGVISSVDARGGVVTCLGSWTSGPTLNVYAGSTVNWSTATGAIASVIGAGRLDTRACVADITIISHQPEPGAELLVGDSDIDVTTFGRPNAEYTVTYS